MADYVELLSHLKGLSLSSFDGVKSIGFEHPWIYPILDNNIQTLEVSWCNNIKNLVASKASFSNLKSLVIYGCGNLLYLFTSSIAESLTQLKRMKISNCESMREIVSKEDDEESNEITENIIFEQLEILILEDLPMLRWFYSGKRTLCFPALKDLSMFGTLWMTTFSPRIHINPESVKLRSGQSYGAYELQWKDDVVSTIHKMNNEKIRRELYDIKLKETLYFQEMWRGSLPVPEAPFIEDKHWKQATRQEDESASFEDEVIPVKLSLKELVLEKLPNLNSIWNEDPDGVLEFQLLQQVRVNTCKSLSSLFPKSVAKALVNLEKLKLKHCANLVEIIVGIGATPEGAITDFTIFPCLTSLTLLDLPRFNCFFYCCSLFHGVRLKTLNGHAHNPQIEDDQDCLKKLAPKITKLSLGEKEVKMVGCQESHFYNINVSDMQSFNVKLVADELPYTFLEKVPNTENLKVSNSSIKEIFCSERPNNLDCARFLSKLKKLKLAYLSYLTSIGLEHSWIQESSILQTLEILDVKCCFGLANLVTSPICFSNLTDLTVSECDSMIYLFTSTTAKSLTQLKRMEVSYCESIQEIVSNEGEESIHDEIVFE
ncbi:hypothetical protein PIB30_060156 [Stylosanthes scabra]|uniref:Disease resistance protein At4g27190-like leucine-rich repeats domain-containing protein n=1 Tax=Stylosanthes scabra TaxID=79078 RepID=A0ABU6VIY3_9FABA|nr:hypothetical protein [Stylosanthes scabra]